MDKYCGSPFWDPSISWHTTAPDLTPCFERTALLWPLFAFLWITGIYQICSSRPSSTSILGFRGTPSWSPGWTWLTIFKLLNISILILLQVTVFGLNLWTRWEHIPQHTNYSGAPPVLWVTPVITAITHVISGILIISHKSRCVHTSGVQLIHWSLLTIVNALIFQTDLRTYQYLSPTISVTLPHVAIQGIILFLSLLQSFLFCWSDIPSPPSGNGTTGNNNYSILSDDSEKESPVLRCSALSYILYSYCTPLIRQGAKSPLTIAQLWSLVPSLRASSVFPVFSKHFGKPRYGEKRGVFRNIIRPIWKTCGMDFLIGIACKLMSTLLTFFTPKLMGLLIEFVEDKEIEAWKGYVLTGILLLGYMIISILWEMFFVYIYKCYINMFTCLNLLIYQKSMSLSSQARKEKTSGEIVNLMSVDVEHISYFLCAADAVWSSPVFIVVGIYLLWGELGYAFLPGIGILISIIPINWYLMSKSSKYQRFQMKEKDSRIKVISEVLGAIQVVKLYAWEPSFFQQIKNIRDQELCYSKKRIFCNTFIAFAMDAVPFLVSSASFFSFVYMTDGVLDAKKAFTALALFNLLTDPITELPSAISAFVDASVSFKRVNDFVNAEEVHPEACTQVPKSADDEENSVEIEDGTFAWEEKEDGDDERNTILKNVDLSVKSGSLTAIVGSVGAGKSSLLSAILGDMRKQSGQVIIRGKVAYASQVAWILNDTLQENILFGQPFDKEKYKKVVECCCLGPDIEMLPAGDMTEIGEKGINLSGGQKQRVSLARAVYSGADVLLLDDVLSAVDSHVGKEIFNRLLGPTGLLKEKTRILCTHAYQFLSQVDQIVMLEVGRIVEVGTYQQLMLSSPKFVEVVSNHQQQQQSEDIVEDLNSIKTPEPTTPKHTTSPNQGQLIEEEGLETGNVKLSVFLEYAKGMGWSLTISFIVLFGMSEGLTLARNIVLTKWTSSPGSNTTHYVLLYSLLGIGQCVTYLIAFIFVAIASLRASQLLHNNMLQHILHATMRFFNVTPLGRITNRFSSDVEGLDNRLRWQLANWICHVYMLLAVITAIIFASSAYFLIYIVPLAILYYLLQRHYILCMQQLERLLSQAKSPIYAMFQESLNGTSTLRAYKAQSRFMELLGDKIDKYNRVEFPHLIVRRWLSVRMGILGSTVVFVPAVFAVIWRDSMAPGLVGLSISYAVQLTGVLSWLIKVTSYLQYTFVSVERILQYCKVEQEADFQQGSRQCPEKWPERGNISFEEYGTRYRPGLDLVLKQFSARVKGGEKIGIVGRTGAGKSSLTLALFRIVEAAEGQIQIDGVNIAELGLHQLRKRLTVIPQDPVLFSRSLRLNLDPFEEYDDSKIWEALRMAHLKEFVDSLGEGLDFLVSEGGDNLSLGQMQLVCLARAILRKSTILILDEATASVDSATDELIQKTIREQFDGCTILNVAHRLNTVLDSTRILVLDKGEMVEFDTPHNLLANTKSHFYAMAKDAGIV